MFLRFFAIPCLALLWEAKKRQSSGVKYWEVIADNLSKAGWSWGCVSAIDSNGRTIWIADTQRGDGKRCLKKERERHPQSVRALLYENGTILTRRQPRSDSLIAKQANGQASKSREIQRVRGRGALRLWKIRFW
jgi:hypothetical protein